MANLALLRRTVEHIAANPASFNMAYWGTGKLAEAVDGDVGDQYGPIFGKPVCGTTACLAGWATVLDALGDTVPAEAGVHRVLVSEEIGMDVLDLHRDDAVRLFYDSNWQQQFRKLYKEAVAAKDGYLAVKALVGQIRSMPRLAPALKGFRLRKPDAIR